MRAYLAIVLFAAALSACGSTTPKAREDVPAAGHHSSAASGRIDSCVDRLLQHAASDASAEAGRRYVRDTYCARFERNGWIYEDGALSIAAYSWLEKSGTCATATAGNPVRTVTCEEVGHLGPRVLDCALLRHVRTSEVRDYLGRLEHESAVECDDGTPLGNLGVP